MPFLVCTFIMMYCVPITYATIIEVPNEASSITLALDNSNTSDTIWVHPGYYPERLIFPRHDVVLISDYFMTGDTEAVSGTLVDASAFAEQDTASVLTFLPGTTRATFVGGFTLTGGHGYNAPAGRWGGCIYVVGSSPAIHSCKITENESEGGFVLYSMEGSPLISHCEIF